QKPQHGPGGLRRRTVPFPRLALIPVRQAVLPPPAVRVLPLFEPGDGTADVRTVHVLTDGAEPDQHRPPALNVIHPPAPPPPAARLLHGAEEVERSAGATEVRVIPEGAHHL